MSSSFACLFSELYTVDRLLLACGDYYKINPTDVGYIFNPEYPDGASPRMFCIWLVEAPAGYKVNISIYFQGDKYKKACVDYVQIRDGHRRAPILAELCDEKKDHKIIQSTTQWMWIMLKTDNFSDSPAKLFSEFSAFTEVTNETQPDKLEHKKKTERDCRSYEFECRNKECISMSYRCDHVNDCGCTIDCDESGCDGITLQKLHQFLVGLCIGLFVFMSVCLMTCLIEGQSNWIASRVEELRMRENQAEERRKKAFKAFTKFIGEKEV
ncbi:hypothetical protein Btru_062597 [Bulinus truncatus]|nr:hypothetical protein Btru_062597 [Bulinus truncatus]